MPVDNNSNDTIKYTQQIEKITNILSTFKSRPGIASSILTGSHTFSKSKLFSRTLLWKTSLLNIDLHSDSINLTTLKKYRSVYNDLLINISIPWHLLPNDSIYYKPLNLNNLDNDLNDDISNLKIIDSSNLIGKKVKIESEIVTDGNDPLSNNLNSSLNKKEHSDLDILLMIIADVERLFPEHPTMFIESKNDKINMIEILFRYAKYIDEIRENQNKKKLSYVQGMHELCGVIYAVLKVDLINSSKIGNLNKNTPINNNSNNKIEHNFKDDGDDLTNINSKSGSSDKQKINIETIDINSKLSNQIKEFFSSDYFLHDVFSMFQELMSPIIDRYFTSSGIVRESIIFDLKLHHIDLGSSKLPGLATALKENHIESQLWLTRWFRMILTRELGLAYSVRIWDGLIAYGCVGAMSDTVSIGHDISTLLPYIIILLILRIRSLLLRSLVKSLTPLFINNDHNKNDFNNFNETEALSLLLHYPTNNKTISIDDYSSNEVDDFNDILSYNSNDKNDDDLIITHRKSIKQPFYYNVPKMPSAVDLFTDAAQICGLSDSELNTIGPSLIEKYAKGDIYISLNDYNKKLLKQKRNTQSQFIGNVLKRFSSSTNLLTNANETDKQNFLNKSSSSSSSSSSPSSSFFPSKHNNITNSSDIDKNRSRLEMKLKQSVQNRLRDRQ